MYNQHQVFDFGGQEFVSGLFWQTVTSAKGWKDEARAQVKFQFKDMDLVSFCQLKDPFGIPQVGFASSAGGAKANGVSIAATIAKAVAQRANHSNWMGIFPVEGDFYVFVAVLKDALLPEGDFAGSKTEVLERFGQEFGQTNQWEAIYAPKALQIGNSEELTLEDLLPFRGGKLKLKAPCRLETVKTVVPWKRLAIGGVLLAAAAGAAYYLVNKSEEMSNLAQVRQVVEPLKGEQPPIVLPFPWKTEPEPAPVALMCFEAVQRVPDGPGGWKLETVECNMMSGVKFTWQRGDSNAAFIRQTMQGVVFEPADPADPLSFSGDKASIVLSRQLPMPYEGEAVSVMEDARLALISLAQGHSLQGTFKNEPESTTKNERGQTIIKSWKNLTFTLTGLMTPWDFVTITSHIHGLRLKKATRTGDQWKLEGDIYGK